MKLKMKPNKMEKMEKMERMKSHTMMRIKIQKKMVIIKNQYQVVLRIQRVLSIRMNDLIICSLK